MALKARPIHDRIIVKVEEKSNVTEGGIEIVSFTPKKERCGEVLAVGPGVYDESGRFVSTSLKPGDRVVFGSYAGVQIEIDGEDYQIMRESDIALVVPEDMDVSSDGLTSRRSSVHSYYK